MMRLLWIARYFVALPIVPPAILVAFAATTVAGMAATVSNLPKLLDLLNLANGPNAGIPEPGLRIVELLLLLQLFAVSSGFRVPARRGHFDLLFTSGANRMLIGVLHWLLSALPGVACWLAVALTAQLAGRESLMTSDILLTLLIASTAPWALTLPLPRATGAIVCLLAASLGLRIGLLPPPVVFGAAVILVAAGVVWIRRLDVPLEAGQ